jgi:hypothetical protein
MYGARLDMLWIILMYFWARIGLNNVIERGCQYHVKKFSLAQRGKYVLCMLDSLDGRTLEHLKKINEQ